MAIRYSKAEWLNLLLKVNTSKKSSLLTGAMQASLANTFHIDSVQDSCSNPAWKHDLSTVKKGTWWGTAEVMWATYPLLFFRTCHWGLRYRWHLTDLKATSARSPWYSPDAEPLQIKAGTWNFCEGKLLLYWQEVYGHAQSLPQHPTAHCLHLNSNL